jgi:hypothetical protein
MKILSNPKQTEAMKAQELKNNYCEENKIPLLRIPYWEIDNIDRLLSEAVR